MKKELLRFILYATIIYLTCGALNPAVAVTHPLGRNGTHFCGVINDQWNKRYADQYPNRHYAQSAAANLNVGEPRTVRMIYFLPNDRPYQAEVVQLMKDEILNVQTFFAEQMEAHGYGKRTFRVETDPQGEPKVHRVDGQQPSSDYQRGNGGDWLSDIEQAGFDITANVYFIVMDLTNDEGGFGGRWGKNGGEARLLGNVWFAVAAHELGHAFGLQHDFHDGAYIMSYGPGRTRLSPCHAEFLSVHPYFNPNISTKEDDPPTIELISSTRYTAGAKRVPVRLKISGSARLHQAILFATTVPTTGRHSITAGFPEVKACHGLVGNRDTVVEFDYDGVIPVDRSTSLSNPVVHPMGVNVVDMNGNVGRTHFVLFSEALQPLTKISGDNLQGLPNTPLPVPFVVELRDLNDGFPRYEVWVTFTVTAGGGTLSVERVKTDKAGRAESTLTLGPNLGTNTVEVYAEGHTAIFNAVAGTPVDILDANLRAAIEDALGQTPGTPIAPAEIATLTRLEAGNASISDLTGLEHATNLTELSLGDKYVEGQGHINSNSIKDLSPLAELSNLTSLNLSQNNILDLSPLAESNNLTWLDVGGNTLSNISPVAELINLTALRLWRNNIVDVSPVADLIHLTELNLHGNNIAELSPLAKLTSLTKLQLGHNSISDLSPLVTNTGLGEGDEVNVKGNLLNYQSIHTHIPALQSRGVTVEFDNRTPAPLLNISGVITASNNVLIVEVRDNNGRVFKGVPVTFTVTSGGGTLRVTSAITDEKGRAQSTLTLGSDGGTNIVRASVEGISEFMTFSDVQANLPDSNLRAAVKNALGKAPSTPIAPAEMATLTRLAERNANISNLTGLESATNLTTLDLDENNITDISPVVGLTNLTWLLLGANNISDISVLAGLTNLTGLSLYNNNISDISVVTELTNLTKLWLSGNSISDISPLVTNTGLGSGDTVDVRGNALNYASIYIHIPDLQSKGVTVKFDNRTPAIPLKILGDNQEGAPSTILEQPFAVYVRDQNGKAFAGVPVVFTVTEGGGALSITSTVTDANGRAESTLTLGNAPGTNTVTVSVEGISQTVAFSAEAALPPPVPTTLSIVSGDNQNGLTGEVLANPFVVKVRDQYDAPMEGVTVTLAVSAGGGTPSPEMTTTDANGQAESTLTLGPNPGTNTVEVSVEGITETVTFNAIAKLLDFDLSVPTDISLIHVPLKVTAVGGVSKTLTSVADLYDAIGGATAVNSLITYNYTTRRWHSYSSDRRRGTPDDQVLTDDRGIIAVMKQPVTIRLGGKPLGTNGSSTITLLKNLNLVVGVPLKNSGIARVSDLLMLDGIRGNVSAITVSDGGAFKVVTTAGQPGDIPITGGQSFIMSARRAATVTISGQGWTNVSGTAAAPPLALRGIEVGDTTPVLGLSGSIVDEAAGLKVEGFRVTVKNLSTGRAVTSMIRDDDRVGYRLTVVDIETMRAATVGDILAISAQSPDPFIGVQPLRYTVTAEDVKRNLIELPALVAYEIPAETELLANYPNPFNPETWIPYRLAEDAFVTLTIYDLSGGMVRRIDVGHRVAAFYESRSKAIYWDGRNNLGETVASGVYFYHLSAGDYSATRKMLILK